MYPHERSLVQNFTNRPFVLLGVNSDDSKEQLRKIIKEQNITWRSWFGGTGGGAIAGAWSIRRGRPFSSSTAKE